MNDFDVITHRLRYSPDRLEREHIRTWGLPSSAAARCSSPAGSSATTASPGAGPAAGRPPSSNGCSSSQSGRVPRTARLAGGEPHAREPTSILVVDLKGEPALFHTARLAARRAKIPFRYFSFLPDRTSHVFNFFSQSHIDEMSKGHLTQELLQAVGAEYGQAYRASFFSSINEVVLLNTLRHAYGIDSFRKLDRFLSDPNFYATSRGDREGLPGRPAPDVARERLSTSMR